jgi:hypothetical protein
MPVFFVDNQGAWPTDDNGLSQAQLVGNLVLWPDTGKYPTFQPIAMADHPQFDGKIVVMAGSRRVVMAFVKNAQSADDVRKAMTHKTEDVEQYCLAVDALIQAVMLHRLSGGPVNEVSDPLSILAWLSASKEGGDASLVIAAALNWFMKMPELVKQANNMLQRPGATPDAFMISDGIVSTLQQALAMRAAKGAAPQAPKRRE